MHVSQTISDQLRCGRPDPSEGTCLPCDRRLERADVDAYGKSSALQPDMLLKADIILERRSLFSWLVSPLTRVRM